MADGWCGAKKKSLTRARAPTPNPTQALYVIFYNAHADTAAACYFDWPRPSRGDGGVNAAAAAAAGSKDDDDYDDDDDYQPHRRRRRRRSSGIMKREPPVREIVIAFSARQRFPLLRPRQGYASAPFPSKNVFHSPLRSPSHARARKRIYTTLIQIYDTHTHAHIIYTCILKRILQTQQVVVVVVVVDV